MTESTQHGEPAPSSNSGPVLLAFLIADLRGYTHFTAERGDEAAARLASRFAELAERVVVAHQGKLIELRGDEVLATFGSARQALRASLQLRTRFGEEIGREAPVEVGIGIDAGDAVPVKGGYRTGALNLAARLQSLAHGEVFASETVVRLAGKTDGIAFIDRGDVSVKGRPDPERVIQIAPEGELPADLPPLQPIVVSHPTNLPEEPTHFIGRESELAAVTQLLEQRDVRLLTLIGPGGSGKTRLALKVGGALLEGFEHGVFFVSLASVTDPQLIVSSVASALNVKERPTQPLPETLQECLHDKRLLLVLDNFEHLIDGAVVVSDLLAACPRLKVLVTSRAVLHLSWEYDYPVPPLQVPDPKQLPDLEALTQYEAVALFTERAQAVRPDFALTEPNAPAVAEICCRLDGLPLGLELAAARIRYMPPPALLARLSSRLKLLTGGARDAPSRQQTLRATIDWSYSLLSEEEQRLFARLGVFHGGCTVETAERVCNAEGDLRLDTLDGMGSLAEKSLLRQGGGDASRFLMLETIREYALERLQVSGESEQVREGHAQYYLSLAEEAEPALEGAPQAEWIERLEADHDNVRAALGWFLQQGEVEQELRLAGALHRFWQAHTHFGEGRRWLEAGLVLSDDVSVPVRMNALMAASGLAMIQADQGRAIALAKEGLRLAQEHRHVDQERWALSLLGMTAVQQGDYGQATRYLEAGLSLAQEHGSHFNLAQSHYNLGLAKSEEGSYADARKLIEEALTRLRDMGEMYWAMHAVGALGFIALLEGKHGQARGLLREYLETALRFQDKANIAAGLEGLAAVAVHKGSTVHAVPLFAAAGSLRREIGSHLMSLRNRTMIEQAVSSTRERLNQEKWLAAWNEGEAMTIEQAVAAALEKAADPEAATR